jgi:hypothetical protein
VPPAGQLILIKDKAGTGAQFIASPLNLGALSATHHARGFHAIIYDPAILPDERLRWFPNPSRDIANPAS